METRSAVRLTAEAARRLRAARSGRVHSAFARTVNIALDGLGDAGWLSLHGPGPLSAPFGIACDTAPALAGLAGAPVRVEAGALVLDGALRVRLDRAVAADTTLPTAAPLPPLAACLASAQARVTDGLLPVAAAVLCGAAVPSDPLARLAAPALARLHAATAAREAATCVEAARTLLGLGPGLTPAGDDALVGWLVGLRVDGPEGRDLVEATSSALLGAAADRTGPLSCAFLAAGAAGCVAEPVRDFVAAPDGVRLSALLALGATSGADLLAGYLLARHALSLPLRPRERVGVRVS